MYDIIHIKDIIFIPFYHQWGTRYTEKLHNSSKVTQAMELRFEPSWSDSRIYVLNYYDMSHPSVTLENTAILTPYLYGSVKSFEHTNLLIQRWNICFKLLCFAYRDGPAMSIHMLVILYGETYTSKIIYGVLQSWPLRCLVNWNKHRKHLISEWSRISSILSPNNFLELV